MKKRMIDNIIVKVVMLSWLGSIVFMLWPSRISSDWFIKIGMCGVAALVVMCILMAISKLIFLMIKKMKKLILLPFVALFALGCKSKLHDYPTDPPTKHANYLTYVEFEKILHTDTGILDQSTYYRWEVLQFNPGFEGDHRWNTLHFNPSLYSRVEIHYKILYWTELPPDPIGTSFEATSGTIRPEK